MTLEDHIDRIIGAYPFGIWVVAEDSGITVNDLRNIRPGRILVARDTEAIKFIPGGECITLGCIAGWISDEEVAP